VGRKDHGHPFFSLLFFCNFSSFSFVICFCVAQAVGAIIATTVSTFTGLIGQPRIFFRMGKLKNNKLLVCLILVLLLTSARDGLWLPLFGRLNPKTGVPTAGVVSSLSCFYCVSHFLAFRF
jgi:amino acid transporter